MIFETASPESTGIPSYAVKNFLTRLEKQQLPLHSAIIMRHGKICAETYYAPYNKDSLHRMFSITKSFVSMAIGCLAEEGKLKLDDKIVDYFPEKQPESGTYKYTAMLTIRDMLKMKTCHTKTTYKNPGVTGSAHFLQLNQLMFPELFFHMILLQHMYLVHLLRNYRE